MDPLLLICPVCHIQVRPTDFFCFNCGKNLHEKPPSLSLGTQLMLYIGSIVLTPMGFFWGLRYIRQENTQSRLVGICAMVCSLVTLIVVAKISMGFIDSVNRQLNAQMNLMQTGF